ncbi:hypothetical protein Ancab_034210 [Ancistrocladus abbreviatus]
MAAHATAMVAVVLGMLTFAVKWESHVVIVGGKDGWTQGINYTIWAADQSFYVGDWLLFRFDKYLYDVLEVNETSYGNCTGQEFITNITKGGRDFFQLTEARPYYFICSKGYCYGGMKFTVNATEPISSPGPTPNSNGVDPTNTINSLLLTIALDWAFIMKMF